MAPSQVLEVVRQAEVIACRERNSSATLLASDARALADRGDYSYAARRALASLAYSMGCFSAEYEAAKGLIEQTEAA